MNCWPLLPVFVIGTAAAVNIGMITASRGVGAQLGGHPYAEESHLDADLEAQRRAAGEGAAATLRGRELRLEQAPWTGVSVRCWRPDDPRLDRTLSWPEPARPLDLGAVPAGVWRIRIEGIAGDASPRRIDLRCRLDP